MNAPIRTLACLVLVATTAGGAWAHAALHASEPASGATLATAPAQIRLQFSEPVEPAFTFVKVVGADGTETAAGKASVDPADAKSVVLPLPALRAGAYKARWSTVGRDGHRMKGELGFTVKP